MSHNDTVKQSFKKQAEKFGAYHMSKTEYTDSGKDTAIFSCLVFALIRVCKH